MVEKEGSWFEIINQLQPCSSFTQRRQHLFEGPDIMLCHGVKWQEDLPLSRRTAGWHLCSSFRFLLHRSIRHRWGKTWRGFMLPYWQSFKPRCALSWKKHCLSLHKGMFQNSNCFPVKRDALLCSCSSCKKKEKLYEKKKGCELQAFPCGVSVFSLWPHCVYFIFYIDQDHTCFRIIPTGL